MARPLPQPVRIVRVGGSVRDELLGRPVADRDYVVVGATPEIMLASGFRPVGRDFPVFLHPETQEEHALARTERKHGKGYRGFEFFASPDVTLEEDLARRDLTINAMARDEQGALVDPFGGQADLRAGILRHVSAAFAEDPLRVLRVGRFAARFGFAVAPETQALMRAIVDSRELGTLSSERLWRELAQGLSEAHPARMLAVLRECGALAQLLPEVDALFGVAQASLEPPVVDAGVALAQALEWAAAHALPLPARYAVLAQHLSPGAFPEAGTTGAAGVRRDVALAQRLSERLHVPIDCKDAARLAARWHRVVPRAPDLPAAAILDLLSATDALRRPERLDWLLGACAATICSRPGAAVDLHAALKLRAALAALRAVDGGKIARGIGAGTPGRTEAIAAAVRRARLAALRAQRKAAGGPSAAADGRLPRDPL